LNEAIAIIGIGCRFPGGASSPRRLWELLTQGRIAVVEVPKDRWDHRRYYDPDPNKPGKTYVRSAGFLEEKIDAFDAAFFGISPREASVLDPQQRLLAEVAWEGLEDAGLPPDALAGSATGVYVGGFMLDSMLTHMGPMNRELIGPHTAVGATMTVLSARISYMFDFRGPSISLDTACSSSLVAVHLACQDLWSGECSLSLAGGVNVMFRPEIFVAMSKGKFLSADGYSKGFDARADGYGRGEGAGIVVLKRFQDAIKDGDRIYALIRGTGVNQDGRTESMTAPSSRAQEALIRRVYSHAGVDPKSIQAFEAHGTGTSVGDPAEMRALGAVSKRGDGKGPWVSSLKANIGHLEAAAGVAGLIKASLCLESGRVPPQANLQQMNPNIPFADLGIKVPRQIEELKAHGNDPIRIGVNSFGYGGTNAHALLEAWSQPDRPRSLEVKSPILLPMSAKTSDALKQLAGRYADLLKATERAPLADVCYSAATRRTHHEHRLALVASGDDAAGLATRLANFADSGVAEDGATGRALQGEVRPVFVFTGMGPQWWAMGRELLETDALFRTTLEKMDAIFTRLAGWSLVQQMKADEATSKMARTDIAQPANMLLQIGLLEMYRRAGITPAAVVGHSAGEAAAAYAAGRFDLEQAVLVIYERSRIQAKAAGMGKMLAVGLSEDGARAAIKGREKDVSIAAINGPSAVTLSGSAEAITQIAAELEAKGTFNRVLKVEVPYHSPAMDALKPELTRCLASLRPAVGDVTTYSTVLGGKVEGVSFDALYWCDNIREPTLFARTVSQMIHDGHRLFLEIGPHPVLSASVKECLAEARIEGRIISTLKRGEPEQKMFARALGELYVAGASIGWKNVYPAESRYTPIPSYPWQREKHWQESEEALVDRRGQDEHTLLGPRASAPTPTWERGLNAQFLPCLPDHRVRGSMVVPGATYIEMAVGVRRALELSEPHMLEDVRFEHAMVVVGSDEPLVRTTYDETTQTVSIHSRPRDARTSWTRHATARVRRTLLAPPEEYVKLGDLDVRAANWLDAGTLYAMLKERGLDYGPKLRGVHWILRNESELLAGVQLPDTEAKRIAADPTISLDPCWLDPCLQAMITLLPENDRRLFLPMGCRSVRFVGRFDPRQALFCHAQIRKRTGDSVEGEIALIDNGGRVLVRLTGVEFAALADQDELAQKPAWHDWTYDHAWREADETPAADAKSGWVLFVDRGEIGLELMRALERAGVNDVALVSAGDGFVQKTKTSFQIRPESAADAEHLFAALDTGRYPNAAYLWGLDAGAGGLSKDTHALLRTVLAFSAARGQALSVVTRDAQRADPKDKALGLAAAPLVGLVRVVAAEVPNLHVRSIDVDAKLTASGGAEIERLAKELLAKTDDDEIALRDGHRFIRKLEAKPLGEWEEKSEAAPTEARQVFEIALDGSERRPRRAARLAPGKSEMEIEVEVATLTRGTATRGKRSSVSPWPIEISGVVAAVGAEVTGYAVGQRVQALLAQAPKAIGTHALVRIGRDLVARGGAAGRMLPALAAELALHAQSRIRPEERLLVLGNAGGIGLACLELGKAAGAQIAIVIDRTTEDAPEGFKVFDRRSPSLADEIMEWSNSGAGVDVLVNASVDPDSTVSGVLGPFGRFVDAGPLAPADGLFATAWSRGASCSRVDLAQTLERRPKEAAQRLDALIDRLEYLAPQKGDRWPSARAGEALRWLAERARQDGIARISLALTGSPPTALAPGKDERLFDSAATYLVTGAFGGFGIALTKWMAQEGAQHLVLTGRKGAATEEAKRLVVELEALGVKVAPVAADVASKEDMRALFERIDREMPPLKGVFHTAAVLDDAPLEDLDQGRIEKVMGPKATGALVLHDLTKDRKLDAFVLFSSVSALIGNPKQGNYVAANALLDALAEKRAAAGLAATSIHWGVLDELGMTKDVSVRDYLASLGLNAMSPATALEVLKHAMRVRPTQIGIIDVAWPTLFRSAPHLVRQSRTKHLGGESTSKGQSEADQLRQHLAALSPEERKGEIAKFLADRLAHILQLPRERVDPQKSLSALGVDSLLSMQVQVTIREGLGVEIPALELIRAGSLDQVAGTLSTKFEAGAAEPAAAAALTPVRVTQQAAEAQIEKTVDNMSESEVEAMLRAMLEAQETKEAAP
jgi:acyl transferase domain-containing protein/NADPH:quinone reductase-like Zn-dependent oxidoreductase